MDPLVGSLLFYAFMIVLAYFGHNLIRQSIGNYDLRLFLHEFLATLQMTVCLHEGGVAIKLYGVFGLWLTVLLLVLINEKTVMPYGEANPLPLIERVFMSRAAPGREVLLRLTAEVLAACLSIYVAKAFWMFGLSYEHESLYSAVPCTSSYKWLVAMAVAGASELAFTATLRVLLTEVHKRVDRSLAAVATAAVLATMVALTMVLHVPAFMNPVMALAAAASCHWTIADHVLVHWLCPAVGWIASAKLQQLAVATIGGKKSI